MTDDIRLKKLEKQHDVLMRELDELRVAAAQHMEQAERLDALRLQELRVAHQEVETLRIEISRLRAELEQCKTPGTAVPWPRGEDT